MYSALNPKFYTIFKVAYGQAQPNLTQEDLMKMIGEMSKLTDVFKNVIHKVAQEDPAAAEKMFEIIGKSDTAAKDLKNILGNPEYLNKSNNATNNRIGSKHSKSAWKDPMDVNEKFSPRRAIKDGPNQAKRFKELIEKTLYEAVVRLEEISKFDIDEDDDDVTVELPKNSTFVDNVDNEDEIAKLAAESIETIIGKEQADFFANPDDTKGNDFVSPDHSTDELLVEAASENFNFTETVTVIDLNDIEVEILADDD